MTDQQVHPFQALGPPQPGRELLVYTLIHPGTGRDLSFKRRAEAVEEINKKTFALGSKREETEEFIARAEKSVGYPQCHPSGVQLLCVPSYSIAGIAAAVAISARESAERSRRRAEKKRQREAVS